MLTSLPPVLRADTRLLILGSFPGVASLQAGQYYAHPRNQFWPILGDLLGEPLHDRDYSERIGYLLERRIGLWDVYATCVRPGSLDSSIRDAVPNDLGTLLRQAPRLRMIVHNGAESARRMREVKALGIAAWRLPSTSPANARLGYHAKRSLWREALDAAGVLPRGS
ncbi:G:T/U mismatch-specific uracil/thymine DNA-glycosylase [Thioalkalivibrio nitratireducens DSM 14787]|uniref:G:T/U mismatch-specific uracil/thymine DNA-glycosylase n=1 Tax=Thioalkalivibrio nitratireducens (strain DSM 14787 / UNIQEM 213 / ALEN2) TaxID=1255043 RepID=L0E021_THIND|nr:G:T/U mismatch-specific uracil/thymine DNA-glycosylase [Thioalkalivibrio nitratireducens DSM 14787]